MMVIMKNVLLVLIPIVFILIGGMQTVELSKLQILTVRAESVKNTCNQLSSEEIYTGDSPKTLTAYLGATPTLDGFIGAGEYDDAEKFIGVEGWESDTPPASENSDDLSVIAWVKHDGNSLYFAFDVTDDIIYGFDIERWLPSDNPNANTMNYKKGWPFWGDGIELMMNSTYKWDDRSRCVGDGRSWQFCCSTNKSIHGGLGTGGLSSGLPLDAVVWARYERWIRNGDMVAAVRLKDKDEGRGYIIEWRINPNPCMKIDETTFVDLSKETKVGLNIEFQDLDEKEKGEGNPSSMHHIDYWSKVASNRKADLKSFGTLIIKPIRKDH
jgi:solute:Na+ symporter, SSS family